MSTLSLQNETLRLEFDRCSGSLIGLSALKTNWHILDRPHLGLSFRLLVPLPGRRDNTVWGERQRTTSVHVAGDQRSVTFVWEGITSQYGGSHDIQVTLHVILDDAHALFTMTIDNHSEHIVEAVYCPYLGDVRPPCAQEWFRTFLWGIHGAQEWSVWPSYQSLRGYYGVDCPTQLAPVPLPGGDVWGPLPPFILLRSPQQGLYVGVHRASSELVSWHTELRPGHVSQIGASVPEGLNIGGKEVSIRFAALHMPYVMPGERRALTPIAIQPFSGDWHAGADIYKRWRNSWMRPAPSPGWTQQPHAWVQISINSPEDELRMQFQDLPQLGEDCARYGVRAIQLTGWNDGGQDGHHPQHSPDPRLGTFDELKNAIAQIQAMGVKVVLFSKFTWAERSSEWFRNDLIRLAAKDPYGDYYLHPGYQHQTATQLLDINTRRLVPMCWLSDEYLQVCEREFRNIAELGADGTLIDESLHHGQALLCFDTTHGHRYGAPVCANDCTLVERFADIAQPIRHDFLFAGEACYDWEFAAYHMAYIRMYLKDHIPLMRYLQPHVPIMVAVTGFNDRHMVNMCLLYRYIVSYEPYNFKGRLEDFELTLAYGRRMDTLRTELRRYFWDGEFRHTLGARVTADGQSHHPYAVFVDPTDGSCGVAVANLDDQTTVTLQVRLDNGQLLERYRLVDDTDWRPASSGVVVPPASAAVVIP